MTRRYPRLRASRAAHVLLRQQPMGIDDLAQWTLPDLSREMFAPTGPAKVSESELLELRSALTNVAIAAGYPKVGDESRRQFDRQATRLLGERGLPVDEMLRADTWAWIAVNVTPHLVRWRWQGADGAVSQARYCGIVQRNAVGRLWYRAYVLDQGVDHADRWALADAVTEDAAMSILERTTVASDRRLARSIMRNFLDARSLPGAEARMREGLIRIRIEAVLRELAVLGDAELEHLVSQAMAMPGRDQDAEIEPIGDRYVGLS